ncbi:hypothetical protein HELRODRAFT_177721 [Helobdella robusta]|uniref:C-type lectin domain-containing protein n=1 Tax=Helobdella robusta TaxID=6412 RepID=T1FC46_HELRO|nr:hypothetical protein HELRODRAFT_177721 [Helobdella robusta]ESN97666.1 hypothetical protein HELRODRAFT_177721 [Helobdella robusta]
MYVRAYSHLAANSKITNVCFDDAMNFTIQLGANSVGDCLNKCWRATKMNLRGINYVTSARSCSCVPKMNVWYGVTAKLTGGCLAFFAHEKDCPAGFDYVVEYNKCYSFQVTAKNWINSRDSCNGLLNSHLVIIEDSIENKVINSYSAAKYARYTYINGWASNKSVFGIESSKLCSVLCLSEQLSACKGFEYNGGNGECKVAGGFVIGVNKSAPASFVRFRVVEDCPIDSTYVPAMKSCLSFVNLTTSWHTARETCKNMAPNFHSVVNESPDDTLALRKYLGSILVLDVKNFHPKDSEEEQCRAVPCKEYDPMTVVYENWLKKNLIKSSDSCIYVDPDLYWYYSGCDEKRCIVCQLGIF